MSARDAESTMLAEIREQGDLLERCLPLWREAVDRLVEDRPARRLLLAGCGDMHFAACQVEALAPHLCGAEVRALRSMDLRWARRLLAPGDLVVCASVSGRTPRTVEAALLAQKAGARVLGVTDNPGSPLAEALAETLVLGTAPPQELEAATYAGYRHVIAQTQTFTSVLLVELLLAAALSGARRDLAAVPGQVGALTRALDEPARAAAERLFAGGDKVVVLGSGPHLPAARYGAAKFIEFAVPATAQCLEEFNHLESFVADAGTRIVVLAADAESASRAAELTPAWKEVGARSLVLAARGLFHGQDDPVLWLPGGDLLDAVLAEIIALQLLAAGGVAAMGRDPRCWLGGLRTDQVQAMSSRAIRCSRIWTPAD
ncbi:MAG: SIS domain-containing protein [Planctomycetes bacterium]|nr:SIS domain-containing protein [Planctomycetota bacterium]